MSAVRPFRKAKSGERIADLVAPATAELRRYHHYESAELMEDLQAIIEQQLKALYTVSHKDVEIANLKKALGELHYAANLIVNANSQLTMAGRKCKSPSIEALYKAVCSAGEHLS